MKNINLAITGVGNCASSLLQGLTYYQSRGNGTFAGLMHQEIGGLRTEAISQSRWVVGVIIGSWITVMASVWLKT